MGLRTEACVDVGQGRVFLDVCHSRVSHLVSYPNQGVTHSFGPGDSGPYFVGVWDCFGSWLAGVVGTLVFRCPSSTYDMEAQNWGIYGGLSVLRG